MKNNAVLDIVLNLIGILFLSLGILAIFNSLYIKNPMQIFWMCYLSLLLIGTGIITRNTFLIMSQVYILFIPILIWDIDFLFQFIMQRPLWGITDYFFYERIFSLGKIISLQHLFAIPLSLYVVYIIGRKRNDGWKLSFIQISLSFITISLLTTRDENINCVFDPCINVYFGLPYRFTWFIIFFSMIFLSALVLNKLAFLKINKT